MIKLIFAHQREVYVILIKNKEIFYSDRKMLGSVRLIPTDDKLKQRIIMSRNKLPNWLLDFYNLTDKEKEEYNNAQTEEELSKIIIKDCESQGSTLQKKEIT